MNVVVDTGPLVAFIDRADRAHGLAVRLITELQEYLSVPDAVVVETYYLLRSRVSHSSATVFLEDVRNDYFPRAALNTVLFSRAVEYDVMYSDLKLGLVDASVMALAEAQNALVLTFDFKAFRATRPKRGGWWRLVVEERDLP